MESKGEKKREGSYPKHQTPGLQFCERVHMKQF